MKRISIAAIKAKYQPGQGAHWFDRDSMRFFNTELPHAGFEGKAGIFFVSSEKLHGFGPGAQSWPRRWSVRFLKSPGKMETIGEFNSFNEDDALALAAALCDSMPVFQIVYDDGQVIETAMAYGTTEWEAKCYYLTGNPVVYSESEETGEEKKHTALSVSQVFPEI